MILLAAAAALGLGHGGSATADPRKTIAYGEHLARECTTCHRRDGVDNGIPSITGWEAGDFVTTMEFYRSGARTNPAMVSVVTSLQEDEVKALAAFFATLPKPPPKGKAPPAPARKP
jgi:cytochrome c553